MKATVPDSLTILKNKLNKIIAIYKHLHQDGKLTIFDIVKQAGIVDESYYYEQYPDVYSIGIDPTRHFIEFGYKEWRCPCIALRHVYDEQNLCARESYLSFAEYAEALLDLLNTQYATDTDATLDDNTLLNIEQKWQTALVPMHDSSLNEVEKLRKSLGNLIRLKIEPQNTDQICRVAYMFNQLLTLAPNNTTQYIYQNFIENYIPSICNTPAKTISHKVCNFFSDHFAFLFLSEDYIPYLKAVLECIQIPFYDIVLVNHTKKSKLEDIPYISDINIYIGIEHISNYNYIVYDIAIDMYYDYIKYVKNNIAIGFMHTTNATLPSIQFHCNMFLVQSSHYLNEERFIDIRKIDRKKINLGEINNVCEFAYTGPFQFGNISDKTIDKKYLRYEVESRLGIKIPPEKPLIVCYSGAIADTRQTIYGLNRLCDYCTIIYKTHYELDTKSFSHLDRRIILYKNNAKSQNWLRFAADFLLCEMWKGSFLSSILLGQPVLPYYTPVNSGSMIKNFIYKKQYATHTNLCNFYKNNRIYKILLARWKYFFNLTKPSEIIKAIIEPEYISWFNQNIKSFQNELFGDYSLVDAHKMTANYIMKFFCNGTLGEDCAAIYLK